MRRRAAKATVNAVTGSQIDGCRFPVSVTLRPISACHAFFQAALPPLGRAGPADDTDVERSATLVAVKATGVAVAFARYVDISQAYPKPHTC